MMIPQYLQWLPISEIQSIRKYLIQPSGIDASGNQNDSENGVIMKEVIYTKKLWFT